jgi:hypothetical protein
MKAKKSGLNAEATAGVRARRGGTEVLGGKVLATAKAERVAVATAQEGNARKATAAGPKASGRGQWAVSALVFAGANPVNGANLQLRYPKSISHCSRMNEASNPWPAKSR